MVVVQDENERTAVLDNIVDNQGQYSFRRWQLGRLQQADGRLSYTGVGRLQSGNEINQEANGVVVIFIQGKPGGFYGRDVRQPA